MDIGTTSALNLYNYLTTSTTSRSAAVLQALGSAYTSLTANGDALSSAAGNAGTLPALVGSIYTTSSGAGLSSDLFSSLSIASANATSTASLLASMGSSGLGGLSSAAVNSSASLALTAYTSQLSGLPSTLTAAAQKAVEGIDTNDETAIQTLIQSSQTTAFQSVLDMFS